MALHTDVPTRAEIERLLSSDAERCVSIYLPTHRVTADTDQDRLVLRDLTRQAVDRLHTLGASGDDVADIEEPLLHLVEDDNDFWINQADSLAIFATPDHVELHRLPNHLTASVTVADQFRLGPLLRAITFSHAAWILAVAQGSVRLLELGPSGSPQEVRVEDLPRDAWQSSGNRIHRAREAAYARRIDSALRPMLNGSTLPLILAASQPMAALYRSVNTYPHLVDEREHGSPETTSEAELSDAARAILDELYEAQLRTLAEDFDRAQSVGRTAVDVSDLARLSTLGAVGTLVVDMDASVPGSIDDAGAVTFGPEDDGTGIGLIDEIIRRVLLSGGRVLSVRATDLPQAAPMAAMLRYSI